MNTKTPLISIISPVYNAEKYLHSCVDSILFQAFTDWELLLVDDGSIDKSGEVCDQYGLLDSRIRIFHQKNAGVSAARNKGIQNAKGEWLVFIDADDYFSFNALSIIAKNLETDIDILFWNYIRKSGDKVHKVINVPLEGTIDRNEILHSLIPMFVGPSSSNIGNKLPISTVWLAGIKKKIISNQSFSNVKMAEDKIFIIEALMKSSRVKFINNYLYYYIVNPNSACISYKKDYIADVTASHSQLRKVLEKYDEYRECKDNYNNCSITWMYELLLNESKSSEKCDISELEKFYCTYNIKQTLTWKKVFKLFKKYKLIVFIKLCMLNSFIRFRKSIIKQIKIIRN